MEITEDYVSFETARLLKKAGFNVPVRTFYNPKYRGEKVSDGTALINYNADPEDGSVLCSAPTLQMACKWLREIHDWHISILVKKNYGQICYFTVVENITTNKEIYTNTNIANCQQATEAAIKYCLTNLIE